MYILLFVVIALAVPALLLRRGIVRARREARSPWTIILLTVVAVAFWLMVSLIMVQIIFAIGLAAQHTRTFPRRVLPEGWLPVYVCLAAYLGLGSVLVWFINEYQP